MKKIASLSVFLSAIALANLFGACSNNSSPTTSQPKTTKEIQTSPVASVSPTQADKFDPTISKRWTDTAKILAAMKVDEDSTVAKIQATSDWKKERDLLEKAWAKLETQQLSKIQKWSDQKLNAINSSSPTVFYPFSGPDFLYAYHLFPKGKEYILIGLEPVGKVADLAKLSPAEGVNKVKDANNSLYAILQFSFFRTNDMKVDLNKQGVLPILLLFLARTEQTILDVEYIDLDRDGKIQTSQKEKPSGVKITFTATGETEPRTLYYFSTDLSNDGLKNHPEFEKYIKQIDRPVTYLKAASYLMHYENFSNIRDLVLSQSQELLQDDSGVPVKYFKPETWNLTFYGNYTKPRAPFGQQEYQPDLMKIYRENKKIEKLDFGIGYNFGANESNLLLAEQK